jgi:hypothetical protein
MRAPVYRDDPCWTDQRWQRKQKALAKEAKLMPALTSYFTVSQVYCKWVSPLTRRTQKQPKQPWSPSPDSYQLSDSDFPVEGDLDIPVPDYGNFDIESFDYCYAKMEELDQQGELVREAEADTLYSVSTQIIKVFVI